MCHGIAMGKKALFTIDDTKNEYKSQQTGFEKFTYRFIARRTSPIPTV